MNDLEEFVELLTKTDSFFDDDVLEAIRKANKMLNDSGHTWKTFFRDRIRKAPFFRKESGDWVDVNADANDEPFFNEREVREEETSNPEETKMMLEYCINNGQTNEFISSLYDFFSKRGFLTDKQIFHLRKNYKIIKLRGW